MSPKADPAPSDIRAAVANPIEPAESRTTTAPTVVDQQPSAASPMKSSMSLQICICRAALTGLNLDVEAKEGSNPHKREAVFDGTEDPPTCCVWDWTFCGCRIYSGWGGTCCCNYANCQDWRAKCC
ncbi:hypothetical protein EHS25_002442 [Saitozyma podzolica]|uniref:Uncharacterized protein n=1 Tax=Saitozyma podzolica TaxID=1890683 RepID=A0A427YDY6_9TREE|nr:hypothetical protein EHS25_002442 [Saitozyma podzolica]